MASIFTDTPHELRFVRPGFADADRAWEAVRADGPADDYVDAVAKHLQSVAAAQETVAALCAAAEHSPPPEHPGGPCTLGADGVRSCDRSAAATAAATRTAERTLLIRIAMPAAT